MYNRILRIAVLSLILSFGAIGFVAAETPAFGGFESYVSAPITTSISVSDAQLAWLNQVFNLMGSKDFTFVHRVDADRWMGLYRQRTNMVLHIHHTQANFDFRAIIDRKTGQITLLKGVAWHGLSRSESARQTTSMAVSYLSRALNDQPIFQLEFVASHAQNTIEQVAVHPPFNEASAVNAASRASLDPITRLLEGNRRFVEGKMLHPNLTTERRTETAKGQHPFAVVLTCSDSRLPPELIFDQGIGDIFVVRTAGEVVDEVALGSIEYAVEHLKARHVMVLGHAKCGAVDATVKGGETSDAIARIIMLIKPAVTASRAKSGDLLDNSIRQNVRNMLEKLKTSPVLSDLIHEKELDFSAGYYDVSSGVVSLLDAEKQEHKAAAH